jgi:hypothetical protein
MGGRKALMLAALALAGFAAMPAAADAGKARPDLKVAKLAVTGPVAGLHPGDSLSVSDKTVNGGKRRAAASDTAFYLSGDRSLDFGDEQLAGARGIPKLKAGKADRGSLQVRLSESSGLPAGSYRLLGCADGGEVVRERSETNNCRSAEGTVLVSSPVITPPPPPPPLDTDGDGIDDDHDNCPAVRNPDQADLDGDGEGDACDVCPHNASTTTCSETDPNDQDGDGVPNSTDNCPATANADQSDVDADGKGDVCDPCPDAANWGTAGCPATVYDVNQGSEASGERVRISGMTVTATTGSGASARTWVQLAPAAIGYEGPAYSALELAGVGPFNQGDLVDIDGTVSGTDLTAAVVTVTDTGSSVPANTVTAATLAVKPPSLDDVLVSLSDVTVEGVVDGDWLIDEGIWVDNLILNPLPPASAGSQFTSVVGVARLGGADATLVPRSSADIVP